MTVERISSRVLIPPSQRNFGEGPASYMRERTSGLYDLTPLLSPQNTGLFRTKNWYIDDCLFLHSINDAVIAGRSKAQAENGAAMVFFHRYVFGHCRGVVGDLNVDRDPGQMYLFDQTNLVRAVQSHVNLQGVFIPKALIGYNPDVHSPFIRFAEYGAIGASLLREFDRLMADLSRTNRVDRVALRRIIASLQVALGTDQNDGDVRRRARIALGGLIREYIEQNLEHPDLTATHLLKRFGVSRASLFRIFERDGGVRSYIQQRRLHRAVIDIASNVGARGSISAAADRWGFSSRANFNRAVRNEFGVAPGSLINVSDSDIGFPIAADDGYAFLQYADRAAA